MLPNILADPDTVFTYSDNKLEGEYDANGKRVQEWFWLDDMPVAVVQKNNVIYTIATDHLNTPRQLQDASGKVVWTWNSANFGNLKPNDDPDGDGNKVTFNLRFPGQYYDAETGLHYNYFRDYNPATGRYQQSDPIGLVGGLNTFAYARGNPNKYKDPFGLDVYLCQQPAFGISWNPVDHYWVKTDTLEAGMGGTKGNEPGNESGDMPGDLVQVLNHKDRSSQAGASCSKINEVDENKINEQLKLGRPLGRWGPTNQCQSFARGVISNASTAPDFPPYVWGF